MPRILVVEDEESIQSLLEFNLRQAGFKVDIVGTVAECLEAVEANRPDLVIIDVMLPDGDGFSLYRTLLRRGDTPVIFVTARDDEIDRILGLELGADDYITKPFSPRELVARVRRILQRVQEGAGLAKREVLMLGDITVDLAAHEVRREGQPIPLSPREFALLEYFLRNAGKVLTREQIVDRVWGHDWYGDLRAVDVHVHHLRDKLEKDPERPRHIKTVRGIGYRFDPSKLKFVLMDRSVE